MHGLILLFLIIVVAAQGIYVLERKENKPVGVLYIIVSSVFMYLYASYFTGDMPDMVMGEEGLLGLSAHIIGFVLGHIRATSAVK